MFLIGRSGFYVNDVLKNHYKIHSLIIDQPIG
jgi:hypothetical protein